MCQCQKQRVLRAKNTCFPTVKQLRPAFLFNTFSPAETQWINLHIEKTRNSVQLLKRLWKTSLKTTALWYTYETTDIHSAYLQGRSVAQYSSMHAISSCTRQTFAARTGFFIIEPSLISNRRSFLLPLNLQHHKKSPNEAMSCKKVLRSSHKYQEKIKTKRLFSEHGGRKKSSIRLSHEIN